MPQVYEVARISHSAAPGEDNGQEQHKSRVPRFEVRQLVAPYLTEGRLALADLERVVLDIQREAEKRDYVTSPWGDEKVLRYLVTRGKLPVPNQASVEDAVQLYLERLPRANPERVREARLQRGMTQAQIAQPFGFSSSWVGLVERGQAPVRGLRLQRLARVLGKHVAWLSGGLDPSEPATGAADAARLRARREQLCYSEGDLAALVKVPASQVSAWERREEPLQGPQLREVAVALNVAAAWLTGETNEQAPGTPVSTAMEAGPAEPVATVPEEPAPAEVKEAAVKEAEVSVAVVDMMARPSRLFNARQAAGITQTDLAERLGIHGTTVSAWESGKWNLAGEKLERVAQVLNVPPRYLAGLEEAGAPAPAAVTTPVEPVLPHDAAARLRRLRQRLGLSLEGMAERIGVNPRTYRRWEDNTLNPWPSMWEVIQRLERETPGGAHQPATLLPEPEPAAQEPVAPEAVAQEPVAPEAVPQEAVAPEPVVQEAVVQEAVVPEPAPAPSEPAAAGTEVLREQVLTSVPLHELALHLAARLETADFGVQAERQKVAEAEATIVKLRRVIEVQQEQIATLNRQLVELA